MEELRQECLPGHPQTKASAIQLVNGFLGTMNIEFYYIPQVELHF